MGLRESAVAIILILLVSCSGTVNGDKAISTVLETTMVKPPSDLGPPLDEIPETPDEVVMLGEGPESPVESHLEFVQLLPGYEEGSVRVEGTYPATGDDLHLLRWRQQGPPGLQTCSSVVATDDPVEDWSCSTADLGEQPRGIYRSSYSTMEGENSIEVAHTAGAEATVIELRDGDIHVIEPGDSAVSYHEWVGTAPIRVTVFWPDGFTASQLTS